ncbi:MAG: hypothetical protein N3B14_00755 [Thermoleophilia bacterium]|nr:hypothetical protein [Thermoleophilia bacterium]
MPHEKALAIQDAAAFSEVRRAAFIRRSNGSAVHKSSPIRLSSKSFSKAVVQEGVANILATGGLKNRTSVYVWKSFWLKVRNMPLHSPHVGVLEQLIE